MVSGKFGGNNCWQRSDNAEKVADSLLVVGLVLAELGFVVVMAQIDGVAGTGSSELPYRAPWSHNTDLLLCNRPERANLIDFFSNVNRDHRQVRFSLVVWHFSFAIEEIKLCT